MEEKPTHRQSKRIKNQKKQPTFDWKKQIKVEYRDRYLYITIPKILKYDTDTHYKYDYQNQIFYAKFDDKYCEKSLEDFHALCKCHPTVQEYINKNNQNQNNIYHNCNTINNKSQQKY